MISVIQETANQRLNYADEWQKFVDFATHKDFSDALFRHLDRGLSKTSFTETYRRYAKTLITHGDVAGQDMNFGMRIEFVALANPYADDISAGMPLRLFYKGAARGDTQVEVFEQDPSGDVTVSLLRTDAGGRVTIPVKPGHRYMADAVLLEERNGQNPGDAVWHSIWANLTFEVPG